MSPTPLVAQPHGLAPEAASDGLWKMLTLRANEARQAGKTGLARAIYAAALEEAARMFEAARGPASHQV